MTWLDKFTVGVSTTTAIVPILGVVVEPGWYIIGELPLPSDGAAKLDVIARVSDPSLVLTVRLYSISPRVGEIPGSRVTLSSMVSARVFSSGFKFSAGIYQLHAQAVGGAGDGFFANVSRATPTALST